MDPFKIIRQYYEKDSKAYLILVAHGKAVAQKALEIARKVPELKPDLQFVKEAAMLHDIGIFLVDAPELGCYGKEPYIRHGILGREILEKEGLARHALVCERHIGVGLSIQDIKNQKLPLPKRNMRPISIEEQIIACADNFFRKSAANPHQPKTLNDIRKTLAQFGGEKVAKFNRWVESFHLEPRT